MIALSGGITYDAYAIAFGLTLGAIAALAYALRAKHAAKQKPHDWATEWPEYAQAKPTHVKVVR